MVLIFFIKFLCEPLFDLGDLVDLVNLCGQGTDTVSMKSKVDDPEGSTEKCV